ncbi:hypothetical protein EVJ58_g5927 [Rhodofomes roseus]|uniref:Peptidase M48 domain-containing protein n=1 Tax=Rhodofomes roseus TaxID=34475 RepID=A0A4Y9YBU1_9APHY|nr:hypothetical protein EVJ58_g5927 [Rhodofomes roseus]
MLSSLRPLRALSRTVPLSAHPPRPRAPTSLHVARPARPFSSSSKRTAPKYVRFGADSKQPTNVWRFDLREKIVVGIVVAGGWYYVAHLEQIEDTGRWRFMDVSPQLEAKLARASHEALVAEYGRKVLPPNHPLTRHVRRVVERILEASNLGTLTPPEPAHALPFGEPDGGDIIVFTGILRAARDEEGLAAVLGHGMSLSASLYAGAYRHAEIGHAVLRHMSERVSSAKVLLIIASTFSMLGLEFGLSQMVSRLVYELPNSRMHELEADKVGLRLMSRACYDPQAAPAMFTRLAKLEGAGSRFQFLSTHPATEQRIEVS